MYTAIAGPGRSTRRAGPGSEVSASDGYAEACSRRPLDRGRRSPAENAADDDRPQGPTGGRISSFGHAAKSASTLGVGTSTVPLHIVYARSQAIGLRGSRPVAR